MRAIVSFDPSAQVNSISPGLVTAAVPEISSLQPATMPRFVVVSPRSHAAKEGYQLGLLARASTDRGRLPALAFVKAVSTRAPIYFEAESGSPEIGSRCVVCNRPGAMGRCLECGVLMHHTCIQRTLPG